MTEQRPVAAVLGTELELRLFNYRDTTPLRAGQVDDEPYGGGAGMVLRVDVVAAALDAVYGEQPRAARDRAVAAGPAADPVRRRGARRRAGADAPLLAFRGLRRADRHAPRLGRDLDRPLRPLRRRAAGDGAARRDRPATAGSARRGVGRARELLGRARRRPRVSALHAARRVPRLDRPRDPALRRPRPRRRVAPRAEPCEDAFDERLRALRLGARRLAAASRPLRRRRSRPRTAAPPASRCSPASSRPSPAASAGG